MWKFSVSCFKICSKYRQISNKLPKNPIRVNWTFDCLSSQTLTVSLLGFWMGFRLKGGFRKVLHSAFLRPPLFLLHLHLPPHAVHLEKHPIETKDEFEAGGKRESVGGRETDRERERGKNGRLSSSFPLGQLSSTTPPPTAPSPPPAENQTHRKALFKIRTLFFPTENEENFAFTALIRTPFCGTCSSTAFSSVWVV